MENSSQDGGFEVDHMVDYSNIDFRLNSFKGSSLAQQMPAKRLAQAGFYFTGYSDRVKCYSCKTIVENWSKEDTPIERHKEVSPRCSFLNCVYRTSCNVSPYTTMVNGSTYDEEAEDMQYRLRTREVVDESTYPLVPHMRNEEARLQTFSSWPSAAPVRPRDLAQAGLYYRGEGDQVQCFCCGGIICGWEEGDTAWGEHTKHCSNCFFILGHDVGNIPAQGGSQEEGSNRQLGNSHSSMETFEERLDSFADVSLTIDPERLARAGFFSTGVGDKVSCFSCGGGLKGWQPEEDPWEEHAKQYPGCSFLIAEKGTDFVNRIQLQDRRQNKPASSNQNGFSGEENEAARSAMAQKAIEMGLDSSVVVKVIMEKISKTGSGYSNIEELMEDCWNKQSEGNASKKPDEDPLEKLWKLQREKQCKICMDRDFCMVFIPCAHLATCEQCSKSLTKCPICCGEIKQKVKTYIS